MLVLHGCGPYSCIALLQATCIARQQVLYLHFTVAGLILSIVGTLRGREVACSASDRQGSNFESCVWRAVSSHASHHRQEVILAQFSLYVHKGGLKPDSFHFCLIRVLYGCRPYNCIARLQVSCLYCTVASLILVLSRMQAVYLYCKAAGLILVLQLRPVRLYSGPVAVHLTMLTCPPLMPLLSHWPLRYRH